MDMIPVQILVPSEMASYIDAADQEASFARNAMILYPLIQNLTISHGRAAEILGVSKLDLIDFYNSMGLPYLNQSPEDLEEEIAGFSRLKEAAG